ncbi:MAG TPA: YncE family protein, partial [Pyrinomonadaceae bacterium]|nr:YncE family protein [Pyrinomonadaceae bacterium]
QLTLIKICLLLLICCGLSGAANTAHAQVRAYVTNTQCGTVAVIDTVTNTVVATVPVGIGPFGVAITPDGMRAYVANLGGTVSVIDTVTNTVIATVPVGDSPRGVAITPDGARVYVANAGSTSLSVIDTGTNTVVDTVLVGLRSLAVAITPDGSRLYVANDETITIIDTATGMVVSTIPPRGGFDPFGVIFTPDGTRAYVEDRSEFLNIIDTASNTLVAHILQNILHDALTITPDGTRIYASTASSTTVSVIDTSTNAVVNSIPLGGNNSPTDSALTPDGARLYLPNVPNTVSVIDTASNTLVTTIPNIGCPGSAHRIAIAEVPKVPKSKNDCKDGGYMEFGPPAGPFRNQGQCISYVEAHSR